MPVSDVLKSFRGKGYNPESSQDAPIASPRLIKLTDDEMKDLQGYSQGEGAEQECLVTGRLDKDGQFTVISVRSSGEGPSDEDAMAKQMAGMMSGPPVMQNATMPSPS